MEVLVVITTTPDKETAANLAQTLIRERLAACVQVLPNMTSFYRWKGELETSSEWLLLIKTTRERLSELIARIESEHPYEVPEVVALKTEGGAEKYLQWVREETKR
jgi:periplasmic divalent cation tolerance protein